MKKMKTIEIPEIPEGKKAEWVNGVLTLVDEKPQDITERIKTFDDAVKWCEEKKPGLYQEYLRIERPESAFAYSPDLLAYLKLRIITAALNEGWEPKLDGSEENWHVEYDIEQGLCTYDEYQYYTPNSHLLILKSESLALYAAEQFADIYADFFGCQKGGEE